jgi:hypothetical protein
VQPSWRESHFHKAGCLPLLRFSIKLIVCLTNLDCALSDKSSLFAAGQAGSALFEGGREVMEKKQNLFADGCTEIDLLQDPDDPPKDGKAKTSKPRSLAEFFPLSSNRQPIQKLHDFIYAEMDCLWPSLQIPKPKGVIDEDLVKFCDFLHDCMMEVR